MSVQKCLIDFLLFEMLCRYSQRDMSQRLDRIRLGRELSTSSSRSEKELLRPPMAGRGRGGGTRLSRVDATGGSTSQTGPS